MKTFVGIAALLFVSCVADVYAHDNGLAKTPPMGWNSWNKFGPHEPGSDRGGSGSARIAGRRVTREGDREVWVKQLANGGRAVVLFNRGRKSAKLSVSWTGIGYPPHLSAGVRDLWAGKDLGQLSGTFSAEVPSHGVVMVTINP
jgi:hypothetical protein